MVKENIDYIVNFYKSLIMYEKLEEKEKKLIDNKLRELAVNPLEVITIQDSAKSFIERLDNYAPKTGLENLLNKDMRKLDDRLDFFLLFHKFYNHARARGLPLAIPKKVGEEGLYLKGFYNPLALLGKNSPIKHTMLLGEEDIEHILIVAPNIDPYTRLTNLGANIILLFTGLPLIAEGVEFNDRTINKLRQLYLECFGLADKMENDLRIGSTRQE